MLVSRRARFVVVKFSVNGVTLNAIFTFSIVKGLLIVIGDLCHLIKIILKKKYVIFIFIIFGKPQRRDSNEAWEIRKDKRVA